MRCKPKPYLYKPICCEDGGPIIYQRYFNSILIIISVIILALILYLSGICTYIFENDFSRFPLDINVRQLVEKIDNIDQHFQGQSLQLSGSDLINKALERIQQEDDRFKNTVPLTQFKNLYFPIVGPTCRPLNHYSSLVRVNIVIKSAVNNYARRNAIRNSWYLGNQNYNNLFSFKTVFIVGKCREIQHQHHPQIDGSQNDDLLAPFQINSVDSWLPKYCGENILHESRVFGDIVQASGIDAYYNNTLKTYMTIRWLNEYCHSDFTLYIDDDYVFEVDNFINHLHERASAYLPSMSFESSSMLSSTSADRNGGGSSRMQLESKSHTSINGEISVVDVSSRQAQRLRRHLTSIDVRNSISATETAGNATTANALTRLDYQRKLIALRRLSKQYLWNGYLRNYVHPLRSVLSKWYITRDEYPYNKYPPFITGGATLMSFKTVRHLYYATYFIKSFKFDDVYIGILAYNLGLNALHSENFMCTLEDYMDANPVMPNSTNCIGVHEIEPDSLIELWQEKRRLMGH